MREYFQVLSGSIFTLDDLPQNAFQFHFAPIVSAEVERLFSTMTALLSPQRLNLNFESLKMHLMVLWNTEFVNSNLWKRFFKKKKYFNAIFYAILSIFLRNYLQILTIFLRNFIRSLMISQCLG